MAALSSLITVTFPPHMRERARDHGCGAWDDQVAKSTPLFYSGTGRVAAVSARDRLVVKAYREARYRCWANSSGRPVSS